jgi:hypothetical protein
VTLLSVIVLLMMSLRVLADRVCGTRISVKRVRFVDNCGRFRLRDSKSHFRTTGKGSGRRVHSLLNPSFDQLLDQVIELIN